MSIDHILNEQKNLKKLKRELDSILVSYPAFKINYQNDTPFSISGIYSVIDNVSVLQDEFEIEIFIPKQYPLGFPVLKELGNKIRREDEYHVDENGYACVEITPVVNLIHRTGIDLKKFIEKYVHKFLCWQILYRYDKEIKYWDHKEKGILSFYYEKLGTTDLQLVKLLLHALIKNELPGRNDPCLCGSNKKYKNCHWSSFENLKTFGVDEMKCGLLTISQPIPV